MRFLLSAGIKVLFTVIIRENPALPYSGPQTTFLHFKNRGKVFLVVPVLRPAEDGVHDSCQQHSWTLSRAVGFVPAPMVSRPSGCCHDSLFTAAYSSDVLYMSHVERFFFWGGAKPPKIQMMTEIPAECRKCKKTGGSVALWVNIPASACCSARAV